MMKRSGIDVTSVVTSDLTFQMKAVDHDKHVGICYIYDEIK
jgi:hypothetical protein